MRVSSRACGAGLRIENAARVFYRIGGFRVYQWDGARSGPIIKPPKRNLLGPHMFFKGDQCPLVENGSTKAGRRAGGMSPICSRSIDPILHVSVHAYDVGALVMAICQRLLGQAGWRRRSRRAGFIVLSTAGSVTSHISTASAGAVFGTRRPGTLGLLAAVPSLPYPHCAPFIK